MSRPFEKFNNALVKGNLELGQAAAITGVNADGALFSLTPAELAIAADRGSQTESVTATNTITAAESGKTFFLNSATEFVSTLPAPAVGLKYTFIVAAAPASASYTIVTDSSANIIKGVQLTAQDAGGSGDSGTGDDTITFVDSQAVAGDRVDVISDGTSWFAYATSKVLAGITFTTA